MISTKHTYDLKDIYGGRTYFIQLLKKEEADVVAKTLLGMGYIRKGSWSTRNVPKDKKDNVKYGMWVYPTQKVFDQKISDLILSGDGRKVNNVFDSSYFSRKITYDIFRFVMIEKKFKCKTQ